MATLGLPGAAGVPAGRSPRRWWSRTTSCPLVSGRRRRRAGRRQHGRDRPAGGGVPRGLRAECDRVGALLVFDEVITGFRLDTGGARNKYDVTPDLTTFGKVIGGGLPIGAVGGGREIMETLSPLGPVFRRDAGGEAARHGSRAPRPSGSVPTATSSGRARSYLAALLGMPAARRVSLPSSRSSARSSASCAVTSRRRSTSSRRGGPTLLRSPRSSTPCSTRAWRWLPRTRRSSSGWRTPTRWSRRSVRRRHGRPLRRRANTR